MSCSGPSDHCLSLWSPIGIFHNKSKSIRTPLLCFSPSNGIRTNVRLSRSSVMPQWWIQLCGGHTNYPVPFSVVAVKIRQNEVGEKMPHHCIYLIFWDVFHHTMWQPFTPNILTSPYQYRYPTRFFSCTFALKLYCLKIIYRICALMNYGTVAFGLKLWRPWAKSCVRCHQFMKQLNCSSEWNFAFTLLFVRKLLW